MHRWALVICTRQTKLFSSLSVWWAVSPHLPSMSPCVLQCVSKTVFPLCDFDMRFLPDSDGLRFLRGSVRTCQKGCRIPHCTSKNMIHFGARILCFSWKLLDMVGKISLIIKAATFKYIRCQYSLPPPHPLPKLVRSNQIQKTVFWDADKFKFRKSVSMSLNISQSGVNRL